MKKIIVYLMMLSVLFGCTAKKKDHTGFIINGTLTGITDGKALLQKREAGKFITVDSAVIAQGKFTLKDSIGMPEVFYFSIADKPDKLMLFVEASDIELTANADSISQAKVSGSASHDLFAGYQKQAFAFDHRSDSIYDIILIAKDKKDNAELNKQNAASEAVDKAKFEFTKKFIAENKKSVVAPFLVMQNSYMMELKDLKDFYTMMDPSLAKSKYMEKMQERIDVLTKVEPGQPAPDFTLNTPDGKPISLSSFKGKIVLVDFWASWCSSCRAENPNVVAIYNDFHKKGLEILGVSFDKNKEDWLKAIKDDNLTWNHISDLQYWNCAAGKLYGINAIPSNVLVNKDGKIIAKNLMGDKLRAKLEEILK